MQPSRRWLLVAIPVLAGAVGIGWWRGVSSVRESRRDLQRLQVRLQQLEESTRALSREVEALRREREAKARAARETLDVAAPGEVVVITAEPAAKAR